MPITVLSIVDALTALGGEAHIDEITKHIIATTQGPFGSTPSQTVSARLQERGSGYKAQEKKGGQVLFESEPGTGVWRFRTWATPPPTTPMPVHEEEGAEYEAPEGALTLHLRYERLRDAALINKYKAGLRNPNCEACGFNFKEAYGDLGSGYIEAHHKKPVHTLTEGATTKLSDLAALCPNCHRIIHKNYPMSVEELAAIMSAPGGYAGYIANAKNARKSWVEAVRDAIARVTGGKAKHEFSRQQLIDVELTNIVAEVAAKGETPAQTLSRVLQELRSAGAIDFVDHKGRYRTK